MEKKKFSKGQITSIEKEPPISKFVYGSTFASGEYLYSPPTKYTVHVEGEDDFVVDKRTIMRNYPSKKNVTKTILDDLVGKDANLLR